MWAGAMRTQRKVEKIPITIWGADVFDGTPGDQKLRKFLENALREIMKQSLGIFRRSSCELVMSQHDWDRLRESSENEFLLYGHTTGLPVNHPDYIYGFKIKWIDFSWCYEEMAKQTNDFVFKDGPE